ncbi:hypothetical protein VTK56DRAFT_9342 [Thermocarpiscus australiensis]
MPPGGSSDGSARLPPARGLFFLWRATQLRFHGTPVICRLNPKGVAAFEPYGRHCRSSLNQQPRAAVDALGRTKFCCFRWLADPDRQIRTTWILGI